ncbi:hypothetical protein [Rickettsia endosymbiont of Orchestes rusci]|uniref:hypothetical protein n=1 Tax=Rickettsia endosymbiont of Orchestes rusci TaxID=3066250 RepID=UPI00313DB8E5
MALKKRLMSFLRKQESSKTYKKLVFLYVYFIKYIIFVPILRLFFSGFLLSQE